MQGASMPVCSATANLKPNFKLKPVGSPTNITVSDEDTIVKTMLLMRVMKMPSQKHVLKPMIQSMFSE
jgi:hypothetical protein